MKFIVDEMPKSKSKCPFSEWKPYPPIMEETGHYICKINHNDCNLCETECRLLKEQKAVEPDTDSEGTCTCGNCGETVGYYHVGCNTPQRFCKFCPECGKAVKWE